MSYKANDQWVDNIKGLMEDAKMDYKLAVQALVKAYELGDPDVTKSIVDQIYRDFPKSISYEIEDQAYIRVVK